MTPKIESLNRPISLDKIEKIIKEISLKKARFDKPILPISHTQIIPMLLKLFYSIMVNLIRIGEKKNVVVDWIIGLCIYILCQVNLLFFPQKADYCFQLLCLGSVIWFVLANVIIWVNFCWITNHLKTYWLETRFII